MSRTEDDILTPQEAGDLLRVSAKTIIRLIESGRLPALKVGKQWRIKRGDLERAFAPQPAPAKRRTGAVKKGSRSKGRPE